MRLHILGVCGTLMGSIALLAREQGHEVTGSDQSVYPPMSSQLEAAGIRLTEGYTEASVPDDAELVLVGNAGLPRGNPAVEKTLRSGVPYASGAEWLARHLLGGRWVLAVAGTHGKTSASAMLAWMLEEAGMAPGFLIGGVPVNFGQSARLGEGRCFVIEADEYDTSYFDRRSKFLHYKPRTLIINNLEYDHADIFASLEDIKRQFHLLLRALPDNGLLVRPAEDRNLDDVLRRGCWTPVEMTGSATAQARLLDAGASRFEVLLDGQLAGQVAWPWSGKHNADNALAAILAARHAGVAPEAACRALCGFKGVKRRMERIYDRAGVTVYDDFAHHPTAIATTLAGLRAQVGGERIIALIDPASHTMRQGVHQARLAQSARDADHVIWHQGDKVRWPMGELAGPGASVERNLAAIVEEAVRLAEPPCHIVIMSNGAFGGIHGQLTERLAARGA